MSAAKKRRTRWWLWLLLLVIGTAALALYKTFGPNTGPMQQGNYLYIRTGSTYDDVKRSLTGGGFLKDTWSFELLADYADLPAHVYAGRYKIIPGMSNYDIIRLLRSGRQELIKMVVNKLRTRQDFISFVSSRLEADSAALHKLMLDNSFLAQYHLDTNTAMCAVIPDTYEFFWNTSAEKAFKKIAANYTGFWNESRMQKARSRNLSPAEISVIASIVEEETNKNDEKGNIASVYMNRLGIGMRLQADPTVKFAVNDPTIRRVTGAHLQYDSPYNTYMYAGLPPGPICTPSKTTLDAVLDAPHTKYLFFCAREDFSGYHSFAATLAEHLKNASRYQQALNERGIR